MRHALEASAGLRVLHLLHVLDAVGEGNARRFLLELRHAKYTALLCELEEFCRKHEYQHSKGFGREADAWERAVRMIVGGGS